MTPDAALYAELRRLKQERDRVIAVIKAELDHLSDQEGATIADERVICAAVNAMSHALRIVQGARS